ncbi:aldo/keto reductase [Kibdelosporangium philippinense]|uniref:Aldo/keto reductase n=1 Tax=Kibdelosporangium philippinense TaxID=211113 RepID=A0ABS8Z544_9PSEU|nr:aldo/keto reductase [Kibdelosporangium philippinense]MCE7003031.1 aldo/keto reductase [Kibdelosporangium philippinense]
MRERRFGRLGWKVSDVGYGMWGIAGGEGGWTGADDSHGNTALDEAVRLGCTFFDTAWIYGRGHSEELLGQLVKRHPDRGLNIATKPPPKDRAFPSTRDSKLSDVYPPDHLWEYLHHSLKGLDVPSVDLFQFHVWEDAWAHDATWQDAIVEMKERGLIKGVGISVNRWEPWNVLQTLQTGLIDSVQVIYNIFDQSPEDELFPACRELDIAVIARVPFDEGTLTGTLTRDSRWAEGDWRNTYFVPENLIPSVERAQRLAQIVPAGMTMPELALRFILQNPDVTTVIPGMRNVKHVRSNISTSDAEPLSEELMAQLRDHRWDRQPTEWSQ